MNIVKLLRKEFANRVFHALSAPASLLVPFGGIANCTVLAPSELHRANE
jgi:hypothetical protein